MKCHILFSGKNKKNISKCGLLKILPRVLSVKGYHFDDFSIYEFGQVGCFKGVSNKASHGIANHVNSNETSCPIWIYTVCKGSYFGHGAERINSSSSSCNL